MRKNPNQADFENGYGRFNQPRKKIFIPFSDAAYLGREVFASIMEKSSQTKLSNNYVISIHNIITKVLDFISQSLLDPFSEKQILAAFSPLHCHFLTSTFPANSKLLEPLPNKWNFFSKIIHNHLSLIPFEYEEDMAKITEIINNQEYEDVIKAFTEYMESLLSQIQDDGQNNSVSREAFNNFRKFLENIELDKEKKIDCLRTFEILNRKARIFFNSKEIINFVDAVDEVINKNVIIFQTNFSKSEKMFMLQSTIRLHMLFFRNLEKL